MQDNNDSTKKRDIKIKAKASGKDIDQKSNVNVSPMLGSTTIKDAPGVSPQLHPLGTIGSLISG